MFNLKITPAVSCIVPVCVVNSLCLFCVLLFFSFPFVKSVLALNCMPQVVNFVSHVTMPTCAYSQPVYMYM